MPKITASTARREERIPLTNFQQKQEKATQIRVVDESQT